MAPSIDKLLERLASLEADVVAARAEAREANARAARLENGNGHHTAAATRSAALSRRSLLTKAAAVGAAGIAGTLLLNRPRDVFASFAWTGGVVNAADQETFVTSIAGFPGPAVLSLDGNQGGNPSANIDGLRTTGTGVFSGIAAFGGQKGGTGYYGVGGAATGTGYSGPGAKVWAGVTASGQLAGRSIEGYQQNQQNGAYTWNAIFGAASSPAHNAFSNGVYSYGADRGFGVWGDGGAGNGATPPINGGTGTIGNSGPGGVGVIGYGDTYQYNNAQGSHGVAGFGNGLGVGGWFTGGRALFALGSTSTAGPPTTNPHSLGDVMLDVNRVFWVCIGSGSPGTWTPLQPGGWNNSLFSAVSTQQYTLVGNNGTTWVNMDPTNLKLTITPTFECRAVFTVSADLWTAAAGYNQDIGIALTGGVYPTTAGQPEGWKESSGSTSFSPNAAHLDTILPLAAGTTYTAQVVWKTNKNAPGILIAAGAGPIGGKFSPTRITASLVATNVGGTRPLGLEKPYEIPAEMQARQQRPGVTPKPRS